MKITKTKSYKAAFTGIVAGCGNNTLVSEGLIPTVAFMPPGAKAGFSNIAVMFAASGIRAYTGTVGDAFKVAVCFSYARCHGIFMSLQEEC